MMINSEIVATVHDIMEPEYDDINDLWYSHLYNEIHRFLVTNLRPGYGLRALDVGCGTGFQSILLAYSGYDVHGFDIASRLVKLAQKKIELLNDDCLKLKPIFKTPYKSFSDEQNIIIEIANKLRNHNSIKRPILWISDATNQISYDPGEYDVIVCCGSVLSFIEDHQLVINLMSNALRKGGTLFIEVEQKCNLDLLWPLIDLVTNGKLHYEQNLKEIIMNLLSKPTNNIFINYPFLLSNGNEVLLPMCLFSVKYLEDLFVKNGLEIIKKQGIHVLTNILPSTLLHGQYPNNFLRNSFSLISKIDKKLSCYWPFWRLGCSVIYCLKKSECLKV